jgi:hypothetical protein
MLPMKEMSNRPAVMTRMRCMALFMRVKVLILCNFVDEGIPSVEIFHDEERIPPVRIACLVVACFLWWQH